MISWQRNGDWLTAPGRPSRPYFPPPSDGFVLGETEPAWANSGCQVPQSQLTQDNTVELISEYDGQLIENKYLPVGRIQVKHKNVTIRNCIINIGNPDPRPKIRANFGIVIRDKSEGYDTVNCRIEHVTIDPINAGSGGTTDDAGVYGITGPGYMAYRCAIRHVSDAFNTNGSNAYAFGCYGATRCLSWDPVVQGPTHNDFCQIACGSNVQIIGNSFHCFDSDFITPRSDGNGVILTGYRNPLPTNILVEKNWFYDAFNHVSSWQRYDEGGPAGVGLVIKNNRHYGKTYWPILMTPAAAAVSVVSGNVAGEAGLYWGNTRSTYIPPGGEIVPYVAANTTGAGVPV